MPGRLPLPLPSSGMTFTCQTSSLYLLPITLVFSQSTSQPSVLAQNSVKGLALVRDHLLDVLRAEVALGVLTAAAHDHLVGLQQDLIGHAAGGVRGVGCP